MSRVPSAQRKAVVKHELSIFGKKNFDINNYYNDNKSLSLELLTVSDEMDHGMVSIATVGLSETLFSNADGTEFATRIELCAGAPADEDYWRNVVISAAFKILRAQTPVMPGSILENIIKEYIPETILPHIYLTVPFLWNSEYFPGIDFLDMKINWLQCIAIHDNEKDFISINGHVAFEALLTNQEINIFDRTRAPIQF